MAHPASFASEKEELTFLRKEYSQLKAAYDEFAQNSKELEEELENEIHRVTEEISYAQKQIGVKDQVIADAKATERGLQEQLLELRRSLSKAAADFDATSQHANHGDLSTTITLPTGTRGHEDVLNELALVQQQRDEARALIAELDGSLYKTMADTDELRLCLLSLSSTLDAVVCELDIVRLSKEKVENERDEARASEGAIRAELDAQAEEHDKSVAESQEMKRKYDAALLDLANIRGQIAKLRDQQHGELLKAETLQKQVRELEHANSVAVLQLKQLRDRRGSSVSPRSAQSSGSTGQAAVASAADPMSPPPDSFKASLPQAIPLTRNKRGRSKSPLKRVSSGVDYAALGRSGTAELAGAIQSLEAVMAPSQQPEPHLSTDMRLLDVLIALKAADSAITQTQLQFISAIHDLSHARSPSPRKLAASPARQSSSARMAGSAQRPGDQARISASSFAAPANLNLKLAALLEDSQADLLAVAPEDKLREECNNLLTENSHLLSQLFKQRNNVTVFCRVRPATADELRAAPLMAAGNGPAHRQSYAEDLDPEPSSAALDAAADLVVADSSTLPPSTPKLIVDVISDSDIALYDKVRKAWRPYAFDRVFGPESTQVDVFREVAPLAQAVMEGYNACILAYGITSSGKTHTMQGPDVDPGINVRIINKMFQLASRMRHKTTYRIHVSMLEIYNEELRDLLLPSGAAPQKLEIRSAAVIETAPLAAGVRSSAMLTPATGVQIPHLTSVEVSSAEEILAVFARGAAMRSTAATNIHEHSSRSHCVLRVDVEGTPAAGDGAGIMTSSTLGRLYLVDLAGSERVRKSAVTGARLKEAQHINKSLSALGDVLEALDKKHPHVPYRNSKLTHLLQDSLCGSARTLMMATVCPAWYTAEETLYSLQFSSRVRNIDLGNAQRTIQFKNVTEQYKSLRADFVAADTTRAALAKDLETLQREKFILEEKLMALRDSAMKSNDQQRKAAGSRMEQMRKDLMSTQEQLAEERNARMSADDALAAMKEHMRKEAHVMATLERDKRILEQRVASVLKDTHSLKSHLTDTKHALASAKNSGLHKIPSMLGQQSLECPDVDIAADIALPNEPLPRDRSGTSPQIHAGAPLLTALTGNSVAIAITPPSSRSPQSDDAEPIFSVLGDAPPSVASSYSPYGRPSDIPSSLQNFVSSASGGGGAPPSRALLMQRERRAKREAMLNASRVTAADAERRAKDELKKLAVLRARGSVQLPAPSRPSTADRAVLTSTKKPAQPQRSKVLSKETPVVTKLQFKHSPRTERAVSMDFRLLSGDQETSTSGAGFMIGIINPEASEPLVTSSPDKPPPGPQQGLHIVDC